LATPAVTVAFITRNPIVMGDPTTADWLWLTLSITILSPVDDGLPPGDVLLGESFPHAIATTEVMQAQASVRKRRDGRIIFRKPLTTVAANCSDPCTAR